MCSPTLGNHYPIIVVQSSVYPDRLHIIAHDNDKRRVLWPRSIVRRGLVLGRRRIDAIDAG
jgi:hypothetical protein